MPKKTLQNIFGLAAEKNADRVTISGSGEDFTCHFSLPENEEAKFKLPSKLENDLADSLRKLLKIAPQELSRGRYCKIKAKKYNLNFRLTILPDKHGEKIIISVLKDEKSLYSLNKLGLQRKEKTALKNALKNKGGLILISSKERQGRTSTLFSLLKELDLDKKSAYFMGLYPEFDLEGLTSLPNTKSNWAQVLKHDSDIIAVDDDDKDTLKQAIITASTRRLVIATIESINSLQALYKILNLGLPVNLVLDNINLITGQSLANLKRKAKTNYRKGREQIGLFEILKPNKKLIKFLKQNQAQINKKTFWEKALKLAKDSDYRPLSFDANKKKEDGII